MDFIKHLKDELKEERYKCLLDGINVGSKDGYSANEEEYDIPKHG